MAWNPDPWTTALDGSFLPPVAGETRLLCPRCRRVLVRYRLGDGTPAAFHELAVVTHYRERHRLWLRLFNRLGWTWLIRGLHPLDG